MKFHKQRILHDPDNGKYGDCFRTALACLLDMEPEDVPHFMHGAPEAEEFWAIVDEWLNDNGYSLFTVAYSSGLELVQKGMKNQNPGLLYLIAGTSPRGTTHQCIGFEDQVIHDPHPEGGGLVGPVDDGLYWVNTIVPNVIKYKAEDMG